MARLRANFVRGTITNNPLAAGDLTINSAGLASFPTVASPDTAVLVLDPGSTNPEIVTVTAHTAAATSATVTRGAEGTTARSHIQGTAWAHGAVAADFTDTVALAGESSAATSTTSTSAVDLVTISGLSILVTQPFRVECNWRKQALAANYTGLGLKVNSTVVVETTVGMGSSSAANEAQDGVLVIGIAPRTTNYLNGLTSVWTARLSSSGAGRTPLGNPFSGGTTALSAPLPAATYTSIAIRAINDTASNAVEVCNIRILTGVM